MESFTSAVAESVAIKMRRTAKFSRVPNPMRVFLQKSPDLARRLHAFVSPVPANVW
jgi:hypothetical protein